MLIVWCDVNSSDEQVHTRMDYLTIVRPQSVSGDGLFSVLENGLQSLGIDRISAETCKKLVGIGTDGASANIAASGLKGHIESHLCCILGCGIFIDLLTPCTIVSKSMQADEIDILGALTAVLKMLKEMDKLASKPLDQWPTYTATVNKCNTEEDGCTVYQLQKLKNFSGAQA